MKDDFFFLYISFFEWQKINLHRLLCLLKIIAFISYSKLHPRLYYLFIGFHCKKIIFFSKNMEVINCDSIPVFRNFPVQKTFAPLIPFSYNNYRQFKKPHKHGLIKESILLILSLSNLEKNSF